MPPRPRPPPRLDTFDLDGNRIDSQVIEWGAKPIAQGSDQTVLAPDGANLSIAHGILADRVVRQVAGGDWITLIEQPWRRWWRISNVPPMLAGGVGFGLFMLPGLTRPGDDDDEASRPAVASPRPEPLLVQEHANAGDERR